jgi:hypothetical protein
MSRLCNILSNVFGCLTVVLLVLGVLTVSPYAWGNDGCSTDSDCGPGFTCSSGVCISGVSCLTNPSPCKDGDCFNPARTCQPNTDLPPGFCSCLPPKK